MPAILLSLFDQPILHRAAAGAISGWLAAAWVDFQSFRTWKSLNDLEAYDWKVATWRWVQGAVVGALLGAGIFSAS